MLRTRSLAAVAAGLLTTSLVAALVRTHPEAPPPRPAADPPPPVTPLFARTEPAANAPVLVLLPDERGVRGWVAGKHTAPAGAEVTLKLGNARPVTATLAADGTFAHDFPATAATPVTASVTLPGVKQPLTARATVLPAPAVRGQTAFFVTDRSAYRPGHTLKFVAFLRKLDADGEFEPPEFPAGADREVLVDITSQTKQTRAARVRVRADANGRVTGEYTFSDADALDHYTLTANGFAGSARVLLGEYRKTKVGLKLAGEVKDGKLHVTFDARDYLDRPVKGTAATYTAAVARSAEPEKLTLNPDEFAHPEGGPPGSDELEALPDDERLLTLANGVSAMTFAGFGSRHVAGREGSVPVADGAATLVLDLHPEWLKGGHTATVSGVFTDDTGRENRATGTFKLDPKPERGVTVSTDRELFAAGEKVPVTLAPFGLKPGDKPATTLVVVRLDAQPASPWVTQEFDADIQVLPDNTRLPAIGAPAAKKPAPAADGWKAVPIFDPVKRRIVSATPVTGDAAAVELKQPGAYKLLAVTKLPDGSSFQAETGVVVKAPAKLPGVVLHLDKREVTSGTRLTGAAHTRFAGAKLLLTLRDAQGVKVVKPLTADARGVARIDEALPANLRYGCAVCVQYPESATQVHADQRDLFVVPADRTIGVTATVPAEVGPGAEVKLGVTLDRKEEVDLIVSVFDESLLGVSGDLSKDIRNHFLADARGQARAARDLAATRVGAVTVAELVKKAEGLLADKAAVDRDPALRPQLEGLLAHWRDGHLFLADVVTLVRLTGLEVYLAQPLGYGDGASRWKVPKTATLADLLRWEKKDRAEGQLPLFLSATVVGNVALIGVATRQGAGEDLYPADPWVGHRGNPYGHSPPRACAFGGGYFGGMSCTGFQQVGFGQCGFSCTGLHGGQFSGISGWNFGGSFGGISGFGGGFGAGGLQVGGGHFGIAGFRGGGFGGGFAGLPPSVAGFQGSFSYPAAGNSVFSQGVPAAGGVALPGLGLADEVVRRDFADSAHWTAKLRTDKTGAATATFKLPDSLTNWRVQVTAVSPRMHVGTGTAKFKSTRAVMVWPMLPRTFTEGDTVRVFGTVHNLTDKEQTVRAHLKAENGTVLADAEQTVKVPAKGSVPVYWDYRAGTKGFTDLLMSATCDAGSDASLKKLPVTAAGVLERATASGLVGKGDLKLTLPADFDPARATATVTVAPTLAADLADTLPYLVEYPYGCVEQTMSRFLPAIRVAAILKQAGGGVGKELEAKLPKVVEAGQKRLIELQQPDGGWGWQGSGTTHEMMTPYALFGLIAAEQAGYPCPNPHTIDRGMGRLKQYLDDMGRQWDAAGPAAEKGHNVANDALFCLWVAATRDDTVNLDPWWVRIVRAAETPVMSDAGCAYALEVAVKRGKKPFAGMLAAELRKRAKTSGDRVYWTTARFSRWGDNTTEVTATVMKALVAHDPNDPLIPGVLAYFHATKRGDRWDSTKDTACVLYALCDYLAAVKAGPAAAGEVKVAVNGAAGGTTTLDGPTSKVIALTGKGLKPGENVFAVTGPEAKDGGLARVVVAYTRGRGADISARDHGVKVERVISVRNADGTWAELKSGATVPAGSYVKVRVTATPGPGTEMQYALLESPKPAGGETVPADDGRFAKDAPPPQHVLREDREAMTCFHYEQAHGPVAAEYVVLTEFAGEFRVAPARAELMYKPAVGGHSDSFVLRVEAKK